MRDESSSSENETNKSMKKFFVNNINSWFSRFLIDELTKNGFKESDTDYEFMGTVDTICSSTKLPEGFKPKIISLNIDNKNYNENDIFTNNIILFNLENQNFEEVEYVVKGLKCIKYKKEKTLIIISNIMTWGKSNPTKNLKEIEVKNEIALNNNCDFEEYNEKTYKALADNFIEDEEFDLQGKYNIWKDKFEEEKKKRKEEKERKKKEEEEAKKKVNKGGSQHKEKKSKLRKKKKDKTENEKKSTIDCSQANNNNSNSLANNAKSNNNSSGENSKNSSQHKLPKKSTKRLITKNISEDKANKISPYYYNDNDFNQRIPNYKYKNYKLIENLALSSTNPKLNVYIICPGVLYGYGEDVFFEYFKNSFLHRSPTYFLGEGNNFIPTIHILDLINVVKYVIENTPSKRYIIACDRTRNPSLKNIMKSIYKSMNPYGKCNKLKNSEININNIYFDKYYEINEALIEQNNQDSKNNNNENKSNNKVKFSNNKDLNNNSIENNETKNNNVIYIPNYNKFNIDIKIRPSKLIFGAPPKNIDKFFESELKKKEENNGINNNIKPLKEISNIMNTKGSQELSVINEVNKSQISDMNPSKTSLLINKNLSNNIKSLNNNTNISNIPNISNNKNNSNINNMLTSKNLNTNTNQLNSTMSNNMMMTTSPLNTYSNINTDIYLKQTTSLSEQFNWHCEYGIPENIEKLRNEFIQFRNLKQIKIFITGPPSSGKTYLANYFAKKYSIPLLDLKNMIEWSNLQLDNEQFYKQIVDVKNKLQLEYEEYEDSCIKTKKNTQDDKNKNKKKTEVDEEKFKRFPDDIIISIVKERLKQNDVIASGYILDGFPKSYNDCVKLFCIEDEYKKVELGVNFTLPSEDKKSDNENKKEKSPGNKALARKKAQAKPLKSKQSSNKLASVNSVRNTEEDGLKTDSSKPKELNKKLVPDLIFNIINLSEEKLKNNLYFKHKDDLDAQEDQDDSDLKDNKDNKGNKGNKSNKDNKDDKDIKHKERNKSLDRFERRYKSYKENELLENTNANNIPIKNNIISFFNEFNLNIFDFDYEKIENIKLHRQDIIDKTANEIIEKENEEELAKNKKLGSKILKKVVPSSNQPPPNDNLNSINEEGDVQNEIKNDLYDMKMNYDTLFENYVNQKGNINNKVLLTDEVIEIPIKDLNTYEHIEQHKQNLRKLRRSSTYLSINNVIIDDLKGIRKREIKELNKHKNDLEQTLNGLTDNEKKRLEKETEALRYFLNNELMPKIFEAIIDIGKNKPPDPVKELISYLKDPVKMNKLKKRNKEILDFQKGEYIKNQ